MKRLIPVIFLLKIFLCLSGGVTVTQDKPFVLLHDGDSMEDLTCTHDGSASYYMYWYQQKAGGGLVLIAMSLAADDATPEDAFKGTWEMTRPTNEKTVLKRNGTVVLQDSAVYFCAASLRTGGNAKLFFGEGTILSVIEQGRERIEPKVTIFNPNPKELEDHEHASFVCVASGFYPEHVSITWKVNEEKRQTYDQNKAKYNNNDKTYSISRRLSVTKDEYFNPSNTFRCEASFPDKVDKPVSKEVNGKPACSKAKKDQYRIEVNNGKLSYIMVLCKSALYAIVVAAIMLRKKMKSSTY